GWTYPMRGLSSCCNMGLDSCLVQLRHLFCTGL
ncbi:Uncharacterized protein TCM_026924 isoform 2, partial [Theobroma cacao]